MSKYTLPNWVQGREETMLPLLRSELSAIERSFPAFQYRVLEERGVLFAVGDIELVSGNSYSTHIYFPADYPSSAPHSIIMDQAMTSRHQKTPIPNIEAVWTDGVKPTLYRFPSEETMPTGVDTIYLTARWLSAYESWIRTGHFVHQACIHFDGKQFHVYPP